MKFSVTPPRIAAVELSKDLTIPGLKPHISETAAISIFLDLSRLVGAFSADCFQGVFVRARLRRYVG